MVTLIVLGAVLAVGVAIVGGIYQYRLMREREDGAAKGVARHNEVLSEFDKLKGLLGTVQNDEGLEAELRTDYPYGYVLYGYQNGVTTFIPIEPKGSTRISCDPSTISLELDSLSGKFILKVGKVQYLRAGVNPFTLNVEQFEWKFPANEEHPYETRLLSENGQVFSLVVELISSHEGQYVFVLAFVVRGHDEVGRRIQENGVQGTSGFYSRRLTRLKARYGLSDNEEVGKVLCSLGDALCQEGRVEEGLRQFRSGVEMLEGVKSSTLDFEYGNFAWDLAQFGKNYEEGIVYARKSKALHHNKSAADDSTQMGVNSTLAFCLVELGCKQEAIPLYRENLLATLMQYFRDGRMTHELDIAQKNFANTITSDPHSMTVFEAMCKDVEREAYQRVHGNLDGFKSQLNFFANPDFKGFDQ